MYFHHDLTARRTVPDAINPGKLHYARGEQITVKLSAALETGDQLLFCAKPNGQRETDRLVLVTLTDADLVEGETRLYRKTFSGRTATIATLLGIDDATTSGDIASIQVDCCLVYLPSATPTEEQVGDTFQVTLECPSYDPDDAVPDAADEGGIVRVYDDEGVIKFVTEDHGTIPLGGGSGANLNRTLSATNVIVTSDTGTDATLPAADDTNAGVMTAAMQTKLAGIEASADVTDAANVGSSIHGASAKTTPVDADTVPLIDSAASNVLKKVTWANIKATLKTYFDTLYSTFSGAYADLTGKPTLGTAAAQDTTAFATAAQGLLAGKVELQIACSDATSDLTAGTGKVTFRMPFAMTLTAVRASVSTAPTGSTLIVDINEGGSSILSTKVSIDASEKTSTTAASAAVISDASLADDAEITIDIDQIGASTAGKGLVVTLIGTRA